MKRLSDTDVRAIIAHCAGVTFWKGHRASPFFTGEEKDDGGDIIVRLAVAYYRADGSCVMQREWILADDILRPF